MKFTLPDQLPATAAELSALEAKATAVINAIQSRAQAHKEGVGDELSADDVAALEYALDARDKLVTERETIEAADQADADKLSGLLDRAAAKPADKPADPAAPEAPAADPAPAAAADPAPAADPAAPVEGEQAPAAVAAASKAPASFAHAAPGGAPAADADDDEPRGWEFVPTAPGYAEFSGDKAKVGIRDIAESIVSVKTSSGQQKTGVTSRGGMDFAMQPIAKLVRAQSGTEITTDKELLDEIDRAANRRNLRAPQFGADGGLTAAGGWQSPSEQDYGFCKVSPAVNLVSVPEPDRPIQRGGIRYPVESDMSHLFTDFAFQNHFTETQLEAVDGSNNPTAIKTWSEIPPVEQFIEFRLGVIQYAIKAGILHAQAWPESVAHDVERLMVRHQHGISWRTIRDIYNGSGIPKVVPTETVLGATSSILNGLALQALHLRLDKGLDTDAPVEGIAPVWLREVIRADLTLRDGGLEMLYVSDAQISEFLTKRGIFLQFVDDFQSRGAGQPGNLDAQRLPDYADVILYPAGAWFRALNPVISFGVQYPMELLQYNQYSHGYFEDAIAVGKRCDKSIIVRTPLCVNGAVGAREQITCSYSAAVETKTATVTIGGSVLPTGGAFPVSFTGLGGKTASIAWNSTNTAAKTALAAMDDNIAAAAWTVAGGALPGTPLVITYPAELGDLSAVPTGLTGGTGTTVTVS